MLTFLEKYAKNIIYSQNGEEGIIAEIFSRITTKENLTLKLCEFGAHNGEYCSNTRLYANMGYHALMIEANKNLYFQLCKSVKGLSVTCVNAEVYKDNINELLKNLPYDFDLLSIDTDGDNDYYCFEALGKKPKVIIIEINSGISPLEMYVKLGYHEMVSLGLSKGYFLLCHTGNLVFVDNKYRELFPEIIGDGIENYNEYFNRSWLNA